MREIDWRAQLIRYALLTGPRNDPGEIYSTMFATTLDEFVARGEIRGWRQTKKDSPEDRAGIDFMVESTTGIKVPFSITSTENHAKKRRRKHPGIPTIWLVDDDHAPSPVSKIVFDIQRHLTKWSQKRKRLVFDRKLQNYIIEGRE